MPDRVFTVSRVDWENNQLAMMSKVTVKGTTGSQPVKTVAGGYVGESPGSAMVEIQISSACPSADFEFDPTPVMKNLTAGKLRVYASGKTGTSTGVITEFTFSHAVDTEASLEISFRGTFFEWSS